MFIATKCNSFQLKFFSELYTTKTAPYSSVAERPLLFFLVNVVLR